MQHETIYPVEDREALLKAKKVRQKALKAKAADGIRSKVSELKMGAREVEEAIRVTEERLAVLKGVVADEKRLKEDGGKPGTGKAEEAQA